MLKLFLWLRYLGKRKIVLLSITAVALSVALLVVVSSLFSGFINAFERSAVETVGDVVLTPPIELARYESLIAQLQKSSSVEAAAAVLSTQGLLHLGKGNVRAVTVWGVEPEPRAKVTGFKKFLIRQKHCPGPPTFDVAKHPEEVGTIVGIALLAEPDEKTDRYDLNAAGKMPGRRIILTTGTVTPSQSADGSAGQFKRRTMKLTLVDIMFTGVYDFDKRFVYIPLQALQKELYPDAAEPLADQIQIKLADHTGAKAALAEIRRIWQDFAARQLGWSSYLLEQTSIETAREMQSRFVAELRKQMGILLLIFGVISLSVVLLIMCIFYMIVETRRRDIAVIKSCGAASSSLAWVFVGFGACIGIIGSAAGAMIGCLITRNINSVEQWVRMIFGLKLWKSSVYMFTTIPNEVDWSTALPIMLLAVAAAALGALLPAMIAVRIRPVNILRYE